MVFTHRIFGRAIVGNVLNDGHDIVQRTVRLAHGTRIDPRQHDATILAQIAFFQRTAFCSAVEHPLETLGAAGHILRMRHFQPGFAEQFLARVAQHLAQAVIHRAPAVIRRNDRHAGERQLEELADQAGSFMLLGLQAKSIRLILLPP